MKKPAVYVALMASMLMGATACSSEYPKGLPGKVVEHDSDTKCRWDKKGNKKTEDGRKYKCTTEYKIATQHEDGAWSGFRVNKRDYDKCVTGSQYPKCLSK